jgi:hypothetical protein
MTGTRSGNSLRVSPTLPPGVRGGTPAHGQGRVLGAQGGLATAIQCESRGGPAIHSTFGSNATEFECWWPAARGNPESVGRALLELAKRPAQQVPRERALPLVPEGRKCPAVADRTCTVTPRHAGGDPIRLRGFVCRAAVSVASGTNGQEGAGPSDGVRLPTRSKPSKGTSAGGDADRVRAVFGR